MSDKRKILVVDDEAQILRVLRQILTAHRYAVRTAEEGESALEIVGEWLPDLVLTDLQMPGMPGLELCRRLRAVSEIPIVILSVRNEEETIVEALDTGADDYITKPFGTNELLARIRSSLRRVREKAANIIDNGDFHIDVSAHHASIQNRVLRLTPKEFDLLVGLARNPERALTPACRLQHVWGSYYTEQPEALRVLVGSLRKKIEIDPSNPKYLTTEPWIGYRFLTASL